MRARTLQSYFEAGLQLAGYQNGEYQWMGTRGQWNSAEQIEIGSDIHDEICKL